MGYACTRQVGYNCRYYDNTLSYERVNRLFPDCRAPMFISGLVCIESRCRIPSTQLPSRKLTTSQTGLREYCHQMIQN
jgi:hypothetical protein